MSAASCSHPRGGTPRLRAPLAPALHEIGHLASLALLQELSLTPKPGLVSLLDNGSHDDMDAATFIRSVFGLRSYFPAIARAGAEAASFAVLERLGIEAETKMLKATGGINTHRGAIFALGILCAAGGKLKTAGRNLTPEAIRTTLVALWGAELRSRLAHSAVLPARSKGQRAARAHGLRSAGEEAADAFPVLFDVTLPALLAARAVLRDDRRAMVHALFATMAALDDTNLAHRGGIEGLRLARSEARSYLAAGSVFRPDWRIHADEVHALFLARRLSPGGSADMLACAWWLARVSQA